MSKYNPEYAAAWRAAHPDYHRQYNAEKRERLHALRKARTGTAENRARINAQNRAWAKAHREQNNERNRRWRASGRPVDQFVPRQYHELELEAKKLFPDYKIIENDTRPRWVVLREDMQSEAVLAMLEGRDPVEAVKKFKSKETQWVYSTTGLDNIYGGL